MTNPIPYATPVNVQRLPFKDRRTSLIVAGIFLLLLGGLSACFGALTPIGMFFASTVPPVPATRPVGAGASGPAVTVGATPFPMDFRTIAAAVMVYLGIAGVLIWAGVGAVRVRRWARPVTLVFAGMWLAMGAVGLVYWLLAAPSLQQAMVANSPPGSARPPAAVYSAIAWGTGTFMALLMIVLPAV